MVRYKLRDRTILRWVMDHPGRGAPYTTRSLAAAVQRHHSLIGHLLTGEREDVAGGDAHAISEALGVAVLVLFMPPTSPNQNETATEDAHPAQKENAA